jgi:uncharacterized protein YceH (UPF0502 family)
MELLLDAVEARVLGALIEKEATTPEYYPLSLNALVNACNQKSNRNPVVSYDEDTVDDATLRLREKKLALLVIGSGRVNKYSQRISETLNLGRKELAVLCTLLLRGAQTLGEIRDRSERIFAFEDLEETERALEKMAEWPGIALTRKLERHPGQKESRYVHLLCGEPAAEAAPLAETETGAGAPSRIMLLEHEVRELRSELADLKRRFEELEAQLK